MITLIVNIMFGIVIIGLLLTLFEIVPIDARFKQVLYVLAVILLILWVLGLLGVLPHNGGSVRLD